MTDLATSDDPAAVAFPRPGPEQAARACDACECRWFGLHDCFLCGRPGRRQVRFEL